MIGLRQCALPTLLLAITWSALIGCSRNHYRMRADDDAGHALLQKSVHTPWAPPSNFSVYPEPRSRLYDPSPVNDPVLPKPAPQLYAYQLPELTERDPARFTPNRPRRLPPTERVPLPQAQPDPAPANMPELDFPEQLPGPLDVPANPTPDQSASVQKVSQRRLAPVSAIGLVQAEGRPADTSDQDQPVEDDLSDDTDDFVGLRRVPIPGSYWESIPTDCRRRMFEFESVLQEYEATYETRPAADQLDDSPRLALEDIIELTLLNSREYQTAKETLYRVCLALTLARFEYELKPSVGGNGTGIDYTHNRSDGITDNRLLIGPTDVTLDKVLCTGGDILARFANDVVLTFNGPRGFATEVSSELFFEFTQTIFQWDGELEGLTQAERNVIYAARDFARFRKELFVQQASEYYRLILDFRRVEIDSLNYFTLVREFDQRSVEYRGGFSSRIDLDQIEQQVINGRRSLLNTCTALENSLDDLKLSIGLPTEQLINLDLSELNMLTTRDELAVNAELIVRVRDRLLTEMQSEAPTRATLQSAGAVLIERMLDSIRLRTRLGEQPPDSAPLEAQLLRLQIESAAVEVEEARLELLSELEESPTLTTVLQRRADLVGELLSLLELQIKLVGRIADLADQANQELRQLETFRLRQVELVNRFEQLIEEERLELLQQLVSDVEQLQNELQSKSASLDRAIGRDSRSATPEQLLEETKRLIEQMLDESEGYLIGAEGGLVPVRIDMDDAMLTALVQRFDLINERGVLADDWRQVKLAADDLKSILNLSASQSLSNRTRSDDDPNNFSLDDSTTSVRATLDLPFNRRLQRNRFRNSLFDYQAALRRLALLEDNIKLSVRRELRTLALAREQYVNDVASAALAFERVVSTELELRIGSATSRDFLEAQQAYTGSLNGVASVHIGYITGRLQLFLDLESLTVGDDGFWNELYDDQHQPQASYQLPDYALPAYGPLHPHLKYSHKIKRMLHVPTGTSMVHRPANDDGQEAADESDDAGAPAEPTSDRRAGIFKLWK